MKTRDRILYYEVGADNLLNGVPEFRPMDYSPEKYPEMELFKGTFLSKDERALTYEERATGFLFCAEIAKSK